MSSSAPCPSAAVDAEDMIDGLGAQALLGPFRGEPAGGPGTARRRPDRPLRPGRGPAGRRGRRPQPADRRGRPPGRRRRARRARGVSGVLSGDLDRFRALFEPAGRADRRGVDAPGQVRVRLAPQPAGRGLPGPGVRHEPGGAGRARRAHRGLGRRAARRARSIWSSSARRPRPTRSSCGRAPRKGIGAAFVTSAGYGEAGEDGAPGAGRAGRPRRRAGHPAGRPERSGRGVDARAPVRPDRGAVPARRDASPSPARAATSCRRS